MEQHSLKVARKLKLLERLLISYNDFHHASRIASYIIEHRLQDKMERLSGRRRYRIKLLWEALNSAMVVAYCRPFSGNDRRTTSRVLKNPPFTLRQAQGERNTYWNYWPFTVRGELVEPRKGLFQHPARKVPDLPARFLKELTAAELEVHETAVKDRNTLLAHSDSDAWNMRMFFFEGGPGRKMLVPLHSDVRAPLVHDAVQTLQAICGKLMDRILAERRTLEGELADVLPVAVWEDDGGVSGKDGG